MTTDRSINDKKFKIPNKGNSQSKNKWKDENLNSSSTFILILPVFKRPYFPGVAVPIYIESGIQYETVKKVAQSEAKAIGVILCKKKGNEISHTDLSSRMGVAGYTTKIIPSEHGGVQIVVNLERRFVINKLKSKHEQIWADISYIDDKIDASESKLKAYANSLVANAKRLIKLNPIIREELRTFIDRANINEPGPVCDMAASMLSATDDELQDILETTKLSNRLQKTLILFKKELDLHQIQSDIEKQVELALNKAQKEFVLREQLKTIKKELGIEHEDASGEVAKFESRLKDKVVPQHIRTLLDEEISKLSNMEQHSAEYGVCRNYIDWLTAIPWGLYSKDSLDIKKTRRILNKAHWGMEEIKDSICELVGVGKMIGKIKGNILLLVGPPGVGKTTVAKSISEALGRKFFKFSVGGMRDEAEVKGHRRTYVGSMPGKLIQALKHCQTMNPLILVDEIDKIGSDSSSDPAYALLEVFDYEQNDKFIDHYMDTFCDLSQIMFVLSANVLDSIPVALLDRCEVINLSGYVTEEKIMIARKHLLPKNLKEVGLSSELVAFSKTSLEEIIEGYAREAGVRSFELQIKKILRKIIMDHLKYDSSSFDPVFVSPDKVKKLLGLPRFHEDEWILNPPTGVAVGLAFTSLGGAPMCVETLCFNSEKASMKITGQAGAVLKESAEIALSFCKSWAKQMGLNAEFLSEKDIHIHLPEGATPKDGPSAGITMVSAILSQVLGHPAKPLLAMTGEITLNGNVLAVGGVREKIAAAKRAKLKAVILPELNKQEFQELPKVLKQNLDVHFVKSYDDVFRITFPQNNIIIRTDG